MPSILQSLKVSSVQRKVERNPIQYRRDRLLNIISEQMDAVAAQASGKAFAVIVKRRVTDKFTGERKLIDMPKRFRQCWWTNEDGKTYLELRYGTKPLEIAKGKTTIEVGDFTKLTPTLELIRDAVLLGEFDDLLVTASSRLAAQLRAKKQTSKG